MSALSTSFHLSCVSSFNVVETKSSNVLKMCSVKGFRSGHCGFHTGLWLLQYEHAKKQAVPQVVLRAIWLLQQCKRPITHFYIVPFNMDFKWFRSYESFFYCLLLHVHALMYPLLPINLCAQILTSAASTMADVIMCVETRWAVSSAAARKATSCWPMRGPVKVRSSFWCRFHHLHNTEMSCRQGLTKQG